MNICRSGFYASIATAKFVRRDFIERVAHWTAPDQNNDVLKRIVAIIFFSLC